MEQEVMVSVICPTYNQGRYLRQGLESILMQKTDFEIEILIGEDCSPDDTNMILAEYEEEYPGRFQIFHREKNLKQSKNVYDLFMRSKGKYIIILDLDDYWTDEKKLQKQVDFLEQNLQYIGVAHNFICVDADGMEISSSMHMIRDFLGKPFTLDDFLQYGYVYQTGTFCYRNIWKEEQDWSIIYRADETVVDLTINSVLLSRQPIFILPEVMSVYREVLNENAKNCRSVSMRDRGLRWQKSARQLSILYKYFHGNIDYSRMWSDILLNYFKALMKREAGSYSITVYVKMWLQSCKRARQKARRELFNSLKRKILSIKN